MLTAPRISLALFGTAMAWLMGTASAAVPPQARIPSEFTGIWAEQTAFCSPDAGQPRFTLSPGGFRGLPGEKAYPKIQSYDRAQRSIRVSFYNSNGPLFWRSTEFFRLSKDGNRMEYRFAGGTFHWIRCSGPIDDDRGPTGAG
jgi:hypothetical protein